jgi:mono/diheme cytochrome c family protein
VRPVAALLLALGAGSCAGRAAYTRAGGKLGVAVVRAEPLTAIDANEAVVAAADDGTRRLLLTAQAAWVVRANATERSAGGRRWRRAALIPAADARGTWCVGLDDGGRLWRVRPGTDLEEISDRYGLGRDRIGDLAAAGGRAVAFLLDGALAIADGRRVRRFPAPGARALAGGAHRVALLFRDRVETLELPPPDAEARLRRRSYRVPGVLAAAVSDAGDLFVATRGAVYRARPSAELRLAYLADRQIRWLAAAGARAWFADGDALLTVDDGPTAVAQGAALDPAPAIAGAGDGALWALGDGRPVRIVPERPSAAEAGWAARVQKIFARACVECHRADGKSGVDLSTAAAWLAERDEILERVIARRTMPPSGHPLAEDDRATIAGWLRARARR